MIPSGQQTREAGGWAERRPAPPRRPPGPLSGFLASHEIDPAPHQLANRRALGQAVEKEIIPRLARALGDRISPPPGERRLGPLVDEFTRFILTCDATAAASFVERMDGRIGIDNLYLDLLEPAARHLGTLWTEDLCDFTAVTIAMGRLQQILRAFTPAFQMTATVPPGAGRALLLTLAGEQHTFGLSILEEFFQRAGWHVRCRPAVTTAAAARVVRAERFDIVGFSIGCEVRLQTVAGAIQQVRRTSRNPAIGIMVGGPIFHDNPGLASRIGADGTAADGWQAVLQAQTLMSRQPTS